VRAPMMALVNPDPVLMFPAGTKLMPQVFLRNTTASALPVAASLQWRNPSQSGSVTLPETVLAPGVTRVLNLADTAVPANAYWSTVVLQYQGRRGDIVPIATSFDESGRYGLQTPFAEGVSHLWKGSMWHVDGTHNSLITVGNGGTGPTHAAVTLFYNHGKSFYTVEKQLEPGEQIWTDVGDIIRNQVPDKDGKTIPRDVMMGSYELRDLDHIGVGYLYEGKLVIDKSWGHGYYGCAGCCGYEGQRLLPNPFGGGVGTQGNNTAESEDMCSDSWVDLTSEAYDWASTNSGIVNLPNATSHFMSPGTVTGSTQIQLQRQLARLECPVEGFEPQSTQNAVQVQITAANITQDQVSVVLSGPSGVTGNLTVTLNGPSSVTLGQANNVAAGTYNYSFNRPSLSSGEYTSVSASWTAGAGANASASVSFNVLGITRFSSYNVVYESTCPSGTAQTAYIITGSSGCSSYTTTLNPTFMSQVVENGTGVSVSNGTLQTYNVNTKRCGVPSGASSSDTFYQVTSITGSCNTALSGGTSLATNPNPNSSNTKWDCGDQVLLVNSSDQTNSTKTVQDYCPACSTPGHIDAFSSSQACTVGSIPDYGNFYAIRLR